MKPHIRLTRVHPGIFGAVRPLELTWRCALVNAIVCGYGETPSAAWHDWNVKWYSAKWRAHA